jgi:hypothetical protein
VKNWKETLTAKWLSLFTPSTLESIGEKEQPLLRQVELLLSTVDLAWFADYTTAEGQGIVVDTLYPTFGEYIKAIETHAASMVYTKPVLESLCHRTMISIPINKFFLNEEGYYENVQDNWIAFYYASKRLCEELTTCKESSSSVGNYNLRLLTPLLENIKSILMTMSSLKELTY